MPPCLSYQIRILPTVSLTLRVCCKIYVVECFLLHPTGRITSLQLKVCTTPVRPFPYKMQFASDKTNIALNNLLLDILQAVFLFTWKPQLFQAGTYPLKVLVIKKNFILRYLQNSPIQCFASTIYLCFLFELAKLVLVFEFLVLNRSLRRVRSLMSRAKFLHWERKGTKLQK